LGGLSQSNTVNLTVEYANLPPALSPIASTQLLAGVTLNVGANASDPDVPAQELVYSLADPPAGAVINSTNGNVTWRPIIAQAGSSHLVTVVVSEAGWRTNLLPSADTSVRDGTNAGLNFGSDTNLTVKLDPSAGFTREFFLRFAIPWYPGVAADANLKLYPYYANLPGTHAVALVTNDAWGELATTWNNKPAAGPVVATWLPQAGVTSSVSVVGALLQDVTMPDLLSLQVHATNITGDGRVDYRSREAGPSVAPKLSLFYTNSLPLSTTQSFWVNVVAPQAPTFSEVKNFAGVFEAKVSGDGGPDYQVQASTNLLTWNLLYITNGVPGPFSFVVSNSSSDPQRFYRIRLGP
jgi:hypothetical protein